MFLIPFSNSERKKTHTHPISDHKHISKALFICFCKDTASGIEATTGPATWLTWRKETVILQVLLGFCRGYTDKSKAYVTEPFFLCSSDP